MALKIIFILLLLSYKIAAGLIIHHAGYKTHNEEYYGGVARIGAWGVPHMNPNSSYEVSINLANINGDYISLIRAGLHVHPRLYHNNDLRFFISSSDDATKKASCYNKDCPGFVVANSSVLHLGQAVAPLSHYQGEDCYVTLSIKKDPVTELWTVYREDFDTSSILGWWQKGFLADLDNKATHIQWLAYVTYQDNDTGPTMGSGHYPIEGYHKAAYMMNLKHFDKTGDGYDTRLEDLIKDVDSDCYKALPALDVFQETDRHKFYYGGPAGCTSD